MSSREKNVRRKTSKERGLEVKDEIWNKIGEREVEENGGGQLENTVKVSSLIASPFGQCNAEKRRWCE